MVDLKRQDKRLKWLQPAGELQQQDSEQKLPVDSTTRVSREQHSIPFSGVAFLELLLCLSTIKPNTMRLVSGPC